MLAPCNVLTNGTLTLYRFNREGDLLISCAKDLSASLWRSEDGLRIGTFEGHKGTIWTCDITCESERHH